MAAACAPVLLAYNLSPSATFLNQALAFFLWGGVALACGLSFRLTADQRRCARWALLWPGLLIVVLLLAALASHLVGTLPRSLTLGAMGTLAAALVLVAAGAQAGAAVPDAARQALGSLCLGLLMAGLISSLICCVQVFAPTWADGVWIARSSLAGRGIGNLRQPNHVSTLLLWAAIAAIALRELRWLSTPAAVVSLLLLAAGLVLTASRTAMLGVLLLAVWGVLDKRLTPASRRLLWAAPLAYALCWAVLTQGAHSAQKMLAVEGRLAEADLSASRFAIWADALTLIRAQPWTGVGFGEFNFAWSLSVLPQRPVAFFDHAHNLFIHWAVELGLPGTAVLTLLLLAMLGRLLRGLRRSTDGNDILKAAPPPEQPVDPSLGVRVSLAWLTLIFVHSQLEYPLWYAYFLLPTAWILGLGLAQAGRGLPARQPRPAAADADATRRASRRRWQPTARAPALAAAGVLCMAGALAALADYRQVVALYDGQAEKALEDRLARALRSPLFSHQAAYAAATTSREPEREMDALHQAAHNLLDTRLMVAWAKAYAGSGDLPRAQYLVARLREFRNPAAAEFFAPCPRAGDPTGGAEPFQCLPPDPRVVLRWTHFR
jgi:O-antigen ligase